ncbi:MAG: polysaccharide biosynthesis/export family protein [Bacteroidetes bacterium]|nr:polysaccharide biosynthesis/export family protein [Bacteroidota bacterium]
MKNASWFNVKTLVWLSLILLIISSCIPQKKMLYMRIKSDADTLTEFVNDREVTYKVQNGDNLYIKIVSMDETTNDILNPMGSGGGGGSSAGGGNYLNSYTISEEGYLEFPLVGKIHVKNLTIEEITNLLTEHLGGFIKEFVVIVKLVNFNITILGEVSSPGQYNIYQTDINLFEAIAMAGDMTDFSIRDQVTVIRKTKNGSSVHEVDMSSRSFLSSDYFYLQPDDIVYIKPIKMKQFAFTTFPYGMVMGTISFIIAMVALLK